MTEDEEIEAVEELEEDIYEEEVVESLEEGDEISPEEEAFMKGYRKAEKNTAEEEEEE